MRILKEKQGLSKGIMCNFTDETQISLRDFPSFTIFYIVQAPQRGLHDTELCDLRQSDQCQTFGLIAFAASW